MVGVYGSYLIYPIFLILTYEVISRYLFNTPTIWAHGMSIRIFGIYFLFSLFYVFRNDGHIRMDIFYKNYSPKTQALVNIFTSIVVLAVGYVLLKFGYSYFLYSFYILETDATSFRFPVYPIKLMIPVTGFLLLVELAYKLYGYISLLFDNASKSFFVKSYSTLKTFIIKPKTRL
jgi:TRAP-type mannitol/chloroaromatic compound transport system permease small subunit